MSQRVFDKTQFIRSVNDNVKNLYRKTLKSASKQEIFQAVSYTIKDIMIDQWIATQSSFKKQDPKILYYMSMEFLMGRALGNNLINLTCYHEVKEVLEEYGFDLNAIEDEEPDPALGNGGLGRLAACFLDSLSTLGYASYGCGIRYRYGMFRQKIENGYQIEEPDNWLKNGYPFELLRPEYAFEVKFGGTVYSKIDKNGVTRFDQKDYQSVMAVPYDMPIAGYGNNMVNTLIMWDAQPKEVFQLDSFDKGDYYKAVEQQNMAKNLVEVLYPNDNHVEGKELRLKQQYFFVSASIQRALARFKKHHPDINMLPQKVTFQMNDTHPTVTVAELMRILIDEEGLDWEDAWDIVTKTCAYTNHTIMSEALEKWPVEIFSRLLPRIYQIIDEINRRFLLRVEEKWPNDIARKNKMSIIADNQVKMAHLAIVAGYSVNGVARLHTEILKHQELKEFYEMFPKKFNNKTNGITQRRFLLHANPKLAEWVTKQVGDEWITNLSKIEGIKALAEDETAQKEFMEIKYQNKVRLAEYIQNHNGVEIDPHSVFDVQAKRLHEYKRQLLNILHVMYLYNQIKANPNMPAVPQTFIFGAKAAAGYKIAKSTIKLINSVAEVINNDKSIQNKLKVIFIEDYKVSNAEIIFAAADISEQISTASKEASGTGNMKFMLNGALTIGTMDGANVEMAEEVGMDNIFIFGMSSKEVIEHEEKRDYNPMQIYQNNQDIQKVLNQLVDGTYSNGDRELYRELYNSLLNTISTKIADTYFILADFESYARTHQRIIEAYKDQRKWAKSAILNVAHSGKFSSDRTIQEYVDEIWHLDKVTVDMSEVSDII